LSFLQERFIEPSDAEANLGRRQRTRLAEASQFAR
jgi:hypothetical protein